MTKSLRSPLHQLVDRPSSSSQSSSPTPNERASSNVENGQIRASFDGSANFDLKLQQNPNAFSSPALSLFPSSKFPLDANRQIMPICAQCSQAIVDPFILRVHPDLEFHSDCLKCAECGRLLNENCTAFLRDGKTLCREDYIRLFSRRCPRCDVQLRPTDMVLHARQLVFHMNCFSCVNCQRMLVPGEQFLLYQDEIFCRPDCFTVMVHHQQQFHLFNGQHMPPPPPQVPHQTAEFATLQPPPNIGDAPAYELATLGNGATAAIAAQNSGGGGNFLPSTFARPSMGVPPNCSSVLSQMASSGASPLSFSNPDESLTPSSTNASTPTASNGAIGGGQLHNGINTNGGGMLQANFEAIGTGCNIGAHFASSAGGGSNCSSSSSSVIVHKGKKNKKDKPAQRVRTVLNENQLKILKQTYHGNQRPDTNTKEQLVEMTGLNARVIRVWFQNKRCKDKKESVDRIHQICRRQIEQREKQQSQEKDQTIRSVRATGLGPMTVCSPGPAQLVDPLQSCGSGTQQQFLAPVEIRQFSQKNVRHWSDPPIGEAMDGTVMGTGAAGVPAPMDSLFHPNAPPSMMMPNGGTSMEFLHPPPPNPNFQSLSNGMQLFPQQAISD